MIAEMLEQLQDPILANERVIEKRSCEYCSAELQIIIEPGQDFREAFDLAVDYEGFVYREGKLFCPECWIEAA